MKELFKYKKQKNYNVPLPVIEHPYAYDENGEPNYEKSDIVEIACPRCHNKKKIYDKHGKKNKFCGKCGQALDWHDEFYD